MNEVNAIPVLLLATLGLVLLLGVAMLAIIVALNRRNRVLNAWSRRAEALLSLHAIPAQRPETWIAVRVHSPEAVQRALRLNRVNVCSWSEALAGGHPWFIGPVIDGWIIVTGSDVPEVDEDVDHCFRFLTALSRKLGHVQYFHADPLLHHHAWVRLEAGAVLRAYAWTGQTVWNQGRFTAVEADLGLNCLDYGESTEAADWEATDRMMANVEKIPLLASRWSLDPGRIGADPAGRSKGIAGGSSQFH